MAVAIDDLRYPVGRFTPVLSAVPEVRVAAIRDISELPVRLRDAVRGLTDAQLDTPYRPGGWTVRQVVHHLGDSHAHAFIRLKLALTEDTPTITAYDENAFAGLPDAALPLDPSLALLDALHARWVAIYRGMAEEQYARAYYHPGLDETVTLDVQAQTYAWHSRHHVAHITELRRRQGW